MPTTGDDRGSGVVGPEEIERYEVEGVTYEVHPAARLFPRLRRSERSSGSLGSGRKVRRVAPARRYAAPGGFWPLSGGGPFRNCFASPRVWRA